MRTQLALTITFGMIGCSSSHDAAKPDAPMAQADAAPTPDAPVHQDGVVAIPLTALGGGYSGKMTLGSQSFDMIVDTGSTTTAVADSTCTNCSVHPAYMSAGATDLHQTASAQYGSGSWKGEVFEDGAVMGTRASVALDFASITSQTGFFQGSAYQGILGLGPDGLLLPHTTSYLTKLISTGMTGQVAFQLCPDSGTMWLGGFDPAAATTAPAFTPLSTQAPYYIVSVGAASVGTGGGSGASLTGADFGPTIIDTGTTQTFVPTAVLTALTSAVNGSAGYTSAFGSQTLTSQNGITTSMTAAQLDQALPSLSVTFAGASTPISLPATSSYLADMGNGTYFFTFADSSQLFGSSQKVSLFGNTLLTGLLTVVDVDHKQIGFAPQAGCTRPHARTLVLRRPTIDPATVRALDELAR